MTFLRQVKKVLDRSLETLVMVVVAVLVLDVLLQVYTRLVAPLGRWVASQDLGVLGTVLNWVIPTKPSAWTEELAIFMLIWVSLLGAAVALGRGAHLGIDYFVGKLPERARLATEVFVFFCIAAFSFLVMVVGGIDLVNSMLLLGQPSPALGVQMGYVYLAVPISGFFLTLYAVIGLVERLTAFLNQGHTQRA
jgi:TRAP-type C4-dicarboxylate transport system permease small subunit